HFGTDITHDVYQAALKMRFRIGLADSLFHANYSVRQEELYLFKAATLEAFEHFAPNLNIFSRRNTVVDHFFMTIRFDTDGDINCFAIISDPLNEEYSWHRDKRRRTYLTDVADDMPQLWESFL